MTRIGSRKIIEMANMTMAHPEKWAAERIIELLETAELPPWRKPWKGGDLPRNGVTNRPYNGLNRWMLMMAPFESSLYFTPNQISALGGNIKKGEKSWPVYFWSFPTGAEQKKGKKPFCKGYKVFNIAQTEGMDLSKIKALKDAEEEGQDNNPIEACEAVVNGYSVTTEHVEQRAYYHPIFDKINMPKMETFSSADSYYSTRFHEMAHSTGHKDRLNREGVAEGSAMFGSHQYSQEELIAEFTAAMLSAHCGIVVDTIENSASYVKSWHKRLKNDPECLVLASRQANKAFHFILGTDKQVSVEASVDV